MCDDLQRPFEIFPSVIPFFHIWKGAYFASGDNCVWGELPSHDPGLNRILLIDFETLQLDLCSFLFLAMAFYEKQLPVGPYTIYPARLGKLWSSGSSRKLGQNSSLNWELWGPMKGWQQHMGCALECPTPKNLVRENPHSCQWAVCRKTLLSGAIS